MVKTTTPDTTKDPAAKAAAQSLLTQGLVTKSEMARCAGVSKQLMQHWAAEIDTEKARDAVVSKLWRKELKRHR